MVECERQRGDFGELTDVMAELTDPIVGEIDHVGLGEEGQAGEGGERVVVTIESLKTAPRALFRYLSQSTGATASNIKHQTSSIKNMALFRASLTKPTRA